MVSCDRIKIMMISDVHYSTRPFHGQDQSRVFEWLYATIEREKPSLLISTGDFGEEATLEMSQPILEKIKLSTIYGNHDDLKLIKSLKNYDGSDCWLQDGIIRELDDISIGGISGNIVERKRKPYHKTIDEVKEIIYRYAQSGKVDIFLVTQLVTDQLPILRGLMLREFLFFSRFHQNLQIRR